MIRLYTERAVREEVSKRLAEAEEKQMLRRRLDDMDCEIRELRERVWCLEHPPTTNINKEE